MKDFIDNRAALFLSKRTYGVNLNENASIQSIQLAMDQFKLVADISESQILGLGAYVDEIENSYELIYNGIIKKIDYIENVADMLLSKSKQVPINSNGIISILDIEGSEKNGCSYISGLGIALEAI